MRVVTPIAAMFAAIEMIILTLDDGTHGSVLDIVTYIIIAFVNDVAPVAMTKLYVWLAPFVITAWLARIVSRTVRCVF